MPATSAPTQPSGSGVFTSGQIGQMSSAQSSGSECHVQLGSSPDGTSLTQTTVINPDGTTTVTTSAWKDGDVVGEQQVTYGGNKGEDILSVKSSGDVPRDGTYTDAYQCKPGEPPTKTSGPGADGTDTPPPADDPAKKEPELKKEDPGTKGKETKCPGTDSSTWDDVLSFGKGVLIGAATTVAVVAAGALLTPLVGATAVGIGMIALGAAGAIGLLSGWGSMTRSQRLEAAGGIFGGILAGGLLGMMKRPPPVLEEPVRPVREPPPVADEPAPRPPPEDEVPPPRENEPAPREKDRWPAAADQPHNELLRSPEYQAAVKDGYPTLRPAGTAGGGFLDAQPRVLSGPRTLYRVYDPTEGYPGGWFSDEPPGPSAHLWRDRYAVTPEFNRFPVRYIKVEIPEGQSIKVWEGPGAPARGNDGTIYRGGANQIYLNWGHLPPGTNITTHPTAWRVY